MLHDADWKGAGADLDKAVELLPLDPSARQWRAQYLMRVGRTDEALVEGKKAIDLDPRSASASVDLGWLLYLAHRYSDSIEQLKAAVALDANFAPAHWALGSAYEKAGQLDEAIKELQKAGSLAPGRAAYSAALGYTYARAGRLDEATQIFDRLRLAATREYVSPFDIALVAVGLDDRDTAFKWLAQAVTDRATAVASLAVDPRLDQLRSDSRFKDLLKRAGL
jgi:Flp pilus assembly protein TadD